MYTGFTTAIMDATYITAIRTGAASGLCARYFACPDSEVLTVIGAGVQGKYNTLCMLHLLKNLKTIKVYDIYAPSTECFITEITPLIGESVKIEQSTSYEDAMSNSDVIIASTAMLNEPILNDKWVKPGALVLAVQRHGWNEDVLMKFDKVVVDDYAQFSTLIKAKGCYSPLPESPYAELGEVIVGKKSGRESKQERVISFNCGLAINDLVVAAKVLEKAKELGLGQELCLMDTSKPISLPTVT
jgi:ornithine cyclodeaminase/alanine dehydrogenase-like protein (mu-crystallin family)